MPFFSPGGVFPRNVLRGLIPTASVWGTDPTDLQNTTDGNFATVTGTGSKIMAGAGYYGYLTWDLGRIATVAVAARLGLWSTAGTGTCYLNSSDDNFTYRLSGAYGESVTSAAEVIRETITKIVTGRYIQITFAVSAAATAYAKIYEVAAWELAI